MARPTESALRAVILSFSSSRAKSTMKAGVAEVITAPVCADESRVPANWAQMERK